MIEAIATLLYPVYQLVMVLSNTFQPVLTAVLSVVAIRFFTRN